jgi:hypothetical protein
VTGQIGTALRTEVIVMEEGRVRVADIAGDLETNALDPDLHPESVFLVIKATSESGDTAWAARSAGAPLSSEELLGALEGLAESIRRDLAADWEW